MKEKLEDHPEVEEITVMIDRTIEHYRQNRKFGQMKESNEHRKIIKELKFAKQQLLRVMNMDFNRPT